MEAKPIKWSKEETVRLEMYAAMDEVKKDKQIETLRSELQAARNDLADALDLKNGVGPTALTALVAERNKLRIELQAARAERERLKGQLRLSNVDQLNTDVALQRQLQALSAAQAEVERLSLNLKVQIDSNLILGQKVVDTERLQENADCVRHLIKDWAIELGHKDGLVSIKKLRELAEAQLAAAQEQLRERDAEIERLKGK